MFSRRFLTPLFIEPVGRLAYSGISLNGEFPSEQQISESFLSDATNFIELRNLFTVLILKIKNPLRFNSFSMIFKMLSL